jgi:hypothetical protein
MSVTIMCYKPIIVLLIFTHLIGCTPWKVLGKPVKEQLIQKKPNEVKLKLKSGESFELKNPTFHEDSLTGIKWKNDTLSFAFNDMQETSVREFHLEGTILGLTVSAVAVASLIIWAATHTSVY